MNEILLAPIDSRAKLAKVLTRMEKGGARIVAANDYRWPDGLCWVLLTGDPTKQPEVFDACVIVPEVLASLFSGGSAPLFVVSPECSAYWQKEWGIMRVPALLLLQDGREQKRIEGLRDWAEYCAEVAEAWRHLERDPVQGEKV